MQKRAWYKKLDKTLLVGSRAQGALLFGILLVLTAVAVSSTPSSETKSESSTTSQAAMFSSIPARQGATSNNNTQINNSRNNRADAASGRDICSVSVLSLAIIQRETEATQAPLPLPPNQRALQLVKGHLRPQPAPQTKFTRTL